MFSLQYSGNQIVQLFKICFAESDFSLTLDSFITDVTLNDITLRAIQLNNDGTRGCGLSSPNFILVCSVFIHVHHPPRTLSVFWGVIMSEYLVKLWISGSLCVCIHINIWVDSRVFSV